MLVFSAPKLEWENGGGKIDLVTEVLPGVAALILPFLTHVKMNHSI